MTLLDGLMSPLGKEHCAVYYVMGLLTLFFAVLTAFNGLISCFDKKTRAADRKSVV